MLFIYPHIHSYGVVDIIVSVSGLFGSLRLEFFLCLDRNLARLLLSEASCHLGWSNLAGNRSC